MVAAYVGTADPAELGTWARERLGAAKRPKSLHRLDDLPRTSTGKVRRLDLPGGARPRPWLTEWDVVVVGAGTLRLRAGRPAGRRRPSGPAARGGGRPPAPADFPPDLRDAATMRAAVPGHPANWDLAGRADRRAGRAGAARPRRRRVQRAERGFVHPRYPGGLRRVGRRRQRPVVLRRRPARLPPAGGRPGLRRPARARRGRTGPRDPGAGTGIRWPTRSPRQRRSWGIPAEPDKNAGGGAPGYGPVPLNVVDGVRINTAMAYLSPRRALPALTVRGGVTVRRVLIERGRAVGVETAEGVVRAAEVVLCAGAVGSPHLLLLLGHRRCLRPARAPGSTSWPTSPGVGAEFTDHPHRLRRLPAGPPAARRRRCRCTASCTPPPQGRAAGRPGDPAVAHPVQPDHRRPRADDDLVVGVGLQREESRGRLTLARRRPAPAAAAGLRLPDRGAGPAAAAGGRAPRGGAAADAVAGPSGARGRTSPTTSWTTTAELDGWIRGRT